MMIRHATRSFMAIGNVRLFYGTTNHRGRSATAAAACTSTGSAGSATTSTSPSPARTLSAVTALAPSINVSSTTDGRAASRIHFLSGFAFSPFVGTGCSVGHCLSAEEDTVLAPFEDMM